MATFKKKTISPAAVAVAEANAASAPIVGDPRTHNDGLALAQPVFHDATTKVGSSQDVVIGQIIEVPVERVRSNPLNPRAVYTSAAVDEMAISLTNNGQRVAALGYQEDDGAIVLIEGETRLRGARAAGIPTLRVEIRAKPASERELYEMARAANVERRDQTPLDDAIRWKELLARKIYPTQSALAKALNLGEDYVSRTLSLAQLPHKIVLGVSEYSELMNHKMLNALREYWEQQGDDETFELIQDAARNGLGYRDVVARRKLAAKGPVRRARSFREHLSFGEAKGELRTFEADGRLELKLKGLSAQQAEEVARKIKDLFPTQVT
ncbi:ParB/RepB/Spo0J family partition protein [Ralstonia insidiosa]|jgi:ParB family chromosome partitioning protein|uniref:Chromosome partitioning protein ParB n=1 Tax=Ralstonia insidiosa TaxID=190721 RepID=A0A192A7N6_9RALS|nr:MULTISPECIES: ParB/RepB/Spo0J family partition protein [Ralstonia]KMW44785.1 plasmid stablization protein ParB [Ralstonia sp. MD27]ANJ76353.1 chromosome partitioning protein ParB [Ralstonia insidiosa]MBA9869791.1 ParB/RepB/Spo0J family partition protein [Ralstonia insidiosa]MBA9884929.1 ParB/RepB/Spo0J family partition protein [Ralstonia pickettii]MBA9894670.1 ParB/RepB/Spo0J family partition protein [Ralstonia pickettii]